MSEIINYIATSKLKVIYGFFLSEELINEIVESKKFKYIHTYDEITDFKYYDYFEYKNNSVILFDLSNLQETGMTELRMEITNWIYEQSNMVRGVIQGISFYVICSKWGCSTQFEHVGNLNENQILLKPKKVKNCTDYGKYLSSNWFCKHIRPKVLEEYNYKCAICGNTENLQVHHDEYTEIDIYGHDISTRGKVVLCDNCHERITACTRNTKYKKRNIYYV